MGRIRTIRLSDQLRDHLAAATGRIRVDGELFPEHFVRASSLIEGFLDPDDLEALRATADPEIADASPLAVIENCPLGNDLDDWASPQDGRRPASRRSWVDELILGGFIHSLGLKVHALEDEYGGDFTSYLVPVAALIGIPTGRSPSRLDMHSDNSAILDYSPDAVGLMGVRRDHPILTKFYSLDDLADAIDPRHLNTLQEPIWELRTPAAFHTDGSGQLYSPPVAAFRLDQHGRFVGSFALYNHRALEGYKERASEAVKALSEAASRPGLALDVDLAPGTIVIGDNCRVWHSRGEIRGDRVVLRQYGKRSLAPMEECGAAVPGRPHRYHAAALIVAAHRRARVGAC